MSASSDEHDGSFVTIGIDEHSLEDFAEITLETGHVLIYSTEEDEAWIQSDDYVDLSLME